MTNKMTREQVVESVAAAREVGQQPILSYRDLSYLDLSYLDLSEVDLRGSNLTGTNMTGTDLTDANLRHTNMRCVNMRDADMTGATLYRTNMTDVDMCGLLLNGLPSGELAFIPTANGWYLTIGCWTGTTDELREMIAEDDDWPEAMGREVARRRPMLAGAADMCDAFAAVNSWAVEDAKAAAARRKENR